MFHFSSLTNCCLSKFPSFSFTFIHTKQSLRDSLMLAKSLNIRQLEIEVNAILVIHFLRNANFCNPILSPLIDECKTFLFYTTFRSLMHTHREGSVCVDVLVGSRSIFQSSSLSNCNFLCICYLIFVKPLLEVDPERLLCIICYFIFAV